MIESSPDNIEQFSIEDERALVVGLAALLPSDPQFRKAALELA